MLSFPTPEVPIPSSMNKSLRFTKLEGNTHVLAFPPLATSCPKSRLTYLENKSLNQRLTAKDTSHSQPHWRAPGHCILREGVTCTLETVPVYPGKKKLKISINKESNHIIRSVKKSHLQQYKDQCKGKMKTRMR